MTLQDIKNSFEVISTSVDPIESFDYGEDFLLATGKGAKYPLTFLEIPYNIGYDVVTNRFKTVQFSLLVLFKSKQDDKKGDHELISKAEQVGDIIISKVQEQLKDELRLLSVNGVSLREFSDDLTTGVRLDVTGRTFRTCSTN